MQSSYLTRFFGGSPLGVLLRLAIVSLLVGIAFSALNLHPLDLYYWVRDVVARLYYMGFAAFGDLMRYFLLGAAVVVPIWLISRAISLLGRRQPPPPRGPEET